jgi:hypothetical protein
MISRVTGRLRIIEPVSSVSFMRGTSPRTIYVRSNKAEICNVSIIDENNEPLEFRYVLDQDDGQLLIMTPNCGFTAMIDGDLFDGLL